MQILPGIHKIDGIKSVNCYLVLNQGKMFVVDTGLPGDARNIANYIKRIGRRLIDIEYIILTHADIDHVGCAYELKKITGAKIGIHPADEPILAGKQKFKTINNFLSPVVGLVISTMHYRPVEPDIHLNDGYRINGWQIIHTPGHTLGSISLFQLGRTIFVGDALRTDKNGKPRPVSKRISLDRAAAQRSILSIASRDFESLFPGHGAPIIAGGSAEIRQLVASNLYASVDKS